MSFETNTTTSATVNNEVAIKQAADEMIRQAAQRKGWTVDQIPQEAIDDAYTFVRESVASQTRNEQNEFYHLYNKEKAAREAAEAQLGAVRENRTAKADTRTVDTMEQVRDRMGRATWFQLPESGKLTALGLDPATIDKTQLRSLFGAKSERIPYSRE